MVFFFKKFRKQRVSQPDEVFQIPYNMYMSKYDDYVSETVYQFQICHALSGTDVSLTTANVRNSIF